ncbi:EF-P beta-lysylation protein EpmB [Thiomicrorhabdus sp. ZW0627]|uniref:EF-P beta-lysylation protein EpmB n=1 Tax=Thiomicrorhabdus sp. ZW0627 TaxID=3039774 RepID=UPI002436810F|nr:EF-P beta-lysylation protein EpmB [Thiomicrorhabdus sp. ZW0627]MDG6773956.1 EF-P beta-lysylation protein EpmB [Thiomicrorhabdus sp. ZW0627]
MMQPLAQLHKQLELNLDESLERETGFRFKAHTDFIERIEPGNPDDPLLKQILPIKEELRPHPDFKLDPVGDLNANPTPSLIHKYHGRLLLMASPKCDIHCRYCFRRHFPYGEQINQRHWETALQQIADDNTIHEVILSGGDPFSLAENAMVTLIEKIERIAHVRTLRIHTRTPIVAPSKAPRGKLLEWAENSRLQKVMVVHCNHPNELSDKTAELMSVYRLAGFHLLNQSVLLKGVNDCSETLAELSHKLFSQGILPYYLHQLDRVQGAAHFEVDDATAQTLKKTLMESLPGYLVPKLVREIAGQPHKTPL